MSGATFGRLRDVTLLLASVALLFAALVHVLAPTRAFVPTTTPAERALALLNASAPRASIPRFGGHARSSAVPLAAPGGARPAVQRIRSTALLAIRRFVRIVALSPAAERARARGIVASARLPPPIPPARQVGPSARTLRSSTKHATLDVPRGFNLRPMLVATQPTQDASGDALSADRFAGLRLRGRALAVATAAPTQEPGVVPLPMSRLSP